MRSTRTTQPYRSGNRNPGQALVAMLRGRALNQSHPMDPLRTAQRRRRRPVASADTRGIFR